MGETTSTKVGWLEVLQSRYLGDPSTLILLAVNLLPLLGVLFWGWDLFLLLMLYWMETGIIGFWHILRMALEARWFALFLVPFFVVHFGGFMVGHFVFLGALFGGPQWSDVRSVGSFLDRVVFRTGLWMPLAALFVSHGVSFTLNYLRPQWLARIFPGLMAETPVKRPLLEKLKDPKVFQGIMMAPYQRVILMHVTIIVGGMLSMALHNNKAAFFLLVFLKAMVDMASHVRKNFKPGPPEKAVFP